MPARIVRGDCRDKLRSVASGSVSLVLTDPPYPGIAKEYGVWTEEEWFGLMDAVMPEFRRVLTPGGSAVVLLKPNSEKAGRMRLWVWEFLSQWGRRWNVVQDCYAWNYAQLPFGAATTCGLMRGSVLHCLWFGAADCYRDQDAVLWPESPVSRARRGRGEKTTYSSPSASNRPSGNRLDTARAYASALKRGGTTPFNLIPFTNTTNPPGEAGEGHPARTPEDVVRTWVRYLTRPNDLVLDPFAGSGTTLRVAAEEGRRGLGIEIRKEYVATARAALAERKLA